MSIVYFNYFYKKISAVTIDNYLTMWYNAKIYKRKRGYYTLLIIYYIIYLKNFVKTESISVIGIFQ